MGSNPMPPIRLDFRDQADQKIEDDKTILGSYSANIIYNSRWRNDDFNGDISITPSNNIEIGRAHV